MRATDWHEIDKIVDEVIEELRFATAKYPHWPCDSIHAAGIVVEESGELMQACLDHAYEAMNHAGKDTERRMRQEAVQTAAMALRFLVNLGQYDRRTL
jgi:hypothetical protein